MFRLLTLLLTLFGQALYAQSQAELPAPPAAAHPVSLDELYSDLNVVDAAISPSGRYLAVVVRRTANDLLVVMDLKTGEKKVITHSKPGDAGKKLLMHISSVYWKTSGASSTPCASAR